MCTLPSPACMCSATQTRPRSTSLVDALAFVARWARTPRRRRCAQRRADLRLPGGAQACGPAAARRSTTAVSCTTSSCPASPATARAPRAAAPAPAAPGLPAARRWRSRRRRRPCPAAAGRASKKSSSASTSSILLRRLSSMLMRSMPSVYSPMRGSGITTSSLTLKALVWLADRRGALAVEPELLARLGADGDEALAAARVGDAHHLAGGARHGVGVVAGDVAEQHHLRQAAALALGGVAHRLQVAVVQVLQAGQRRRRPCAAARANM